MCVVVVIQVLMANIKIHKLIILNILWLVKILKVNNNKKILVKLFAHQMT